MVTTVEAVDVDVVVVGGGLAGLSAALRLKDETSKSGKSLSYVVLEADNRLGGRTRAEKDTGRPVPAGGGDDLDFGAGYIGSAQNYTQYLMRRFLIPTVKTYLAEDKAWLYHDPSGNVISFPGNNPLAMPGGFNAIAILGKLDRLTLSVRDFLTRPWDAPDAVAWDGKTVQDWIDEEQKRYAGDPTIGMSPETMQAFVLSVRAAFSLEPKEISMLFLLYYAASAGSYAALVDVAGGEGAAEGRRFALGTKDLVEKLRDEVGQGNIQIGARVKEVMQPSPGAHPAKVKVTLDDGRVFSAKRVIVAMSPTMSDRIDYQPKLSDLPEGGKRIKLGEEMKKAMGRTIKGFVRFNRPFWRANGHMGFLLSVADKTKFPLDWTLDNVWDPAEFGQPGAARNSIMTFIAGSSSDIWTKKTAADRARSVINHLHTVYRSTDNDLLDPTDPLSNYVEFDWANAPAGMPAPAAMMPKGALTSYGSALRTPLGLLHWAGTESAREWVGYMDGAIESGFRSAREVLDLL